jgi:hypothetical protein
MTLTRHFNHHANKQQRAAKTEDDVYAGVRKDAYGNSKFVGGAKSQRAPWEELSGPAHGTEMKLQNLLQHTEYATEVRRERARHVQTHRNSPRGP